MPNSGDLENVPVTSLVLSCRFDWTPFAKSDSDTEHGLNWKAVDSGCASLCVHSDVDDMKIGA